MAFIQKRKLRQQGARYSKDTGEISGTSLFSAGKAGSSTLMVSFCLLNSQPVSVRHGLLEESALIISILRSLNSRYKSLAERGLDGLTRPLACLLLTVP